MSHTKLLKDIIDKLSGDNINDKEIENDILKLNKIVFNQANKTESILEALENSIKDLTELKMTNTEVLSDFEKHRKLIINNCEKNFNKVVNDKYVMHVGTQTQFTEEEHKKPMVWLIPPNDTESYKDLIIGNSELESNLTSSEKSLVNDNSSIIKCRYSTNDTDIKNIGNHQDVTLFIKSAEEDKKFKCGHVTYTFKIYNSMKYLCIYLINSKNEIIFYCGEYKNNFILIERENFAYIKIKSQACCSDIKLIKRYVLKFTNKEEAKYVYQCITDNKY